MGWGLLEGQLSFCLTPCVFEQLGDGSSANSRTTPVDVAGLTSVVSVALGLVRLFFVIASWWRVSFVRVGRFHCVL